MAKELDRNDVMLTAFISAPASDYIQYEPHTMQQREDVVPNAPIYFTGQPREEIDQNYRELLDGK